MRRTNSKEVKKYFDEYLNDILTDNFDDNIDLMAKQFVASCKLEERLLEQMLFTENILVIRKHLNKWYGIMLHHIIRT